VHLDALGLAQARALAERFATTELAAVYSSPLERTRETAEAIAARHELEIVIRPALGEVDYGEWAGRSLEELSRDPRWTFFKLHRGRARIPGGESMREVQARIVAELGHLADRHPDQSFLVVSHGDVLKAAIAHVIGSSLDAILRFDLDPASVTTIRFDADGPRLTALNDVSGLPLAAPNGHELESTRR